MNTNYDMNAIRGPMVAGIEMLVEIANREFLQTQHNRRVAQLVHLMAEEAFPMPHKGYVCAR